jgi:hypothetical protein
METTEKQVCKHCKQEFDRDTKQCIKVYKLRKFCSRKCMHEYAKEYRVCPYCKTKFKANKSSPKSYCSRKCFQNNQKYERETKMPPKETQNAKFTVKEIMEKLASMNREQRRQFLANFPISARKKLQELYQKYTRSTIEDDSQQNTDGKQSRRNR